MGKRPPFGWIAAAGFVGYIFGATGGNEIAPQAVTMPSIQAPPPATLPAPQAPPPENVTVAPARPVITPEPQPPPKADPPPIERQVLYTRSRLNVRQSPSTDAPVLRTLEASTRLTVSERVGPWRKIEAGAGIAGGWVHSDFLVDSEPVRLVRPQAPVPSQPQRLLNPQAGQPVRAPYVGTCDCPYDRMRNGAICGGRSAYSRPGGRSPRCYN